MKILLALFCCLFCLPSPALSAPKQDESLEFLSKSPLLKKAKLNIAPVEIQGERVLLQVMWDGKEGGALLADEGSVQPLKFVDDNATYVTSVKMCGETHKAPARVLPNGGTPHGRFMVLGRIPKGFSLKWAPAVETPDALPASCKGPKVGFVRNQHKMATIAGVEEKIFYALYDSPTLQKRQKELEGKLDEKCVHEIWQFQRLGTLAGSKCRPLLDDPMSCEGTGMYQGTLGAPLGMIELASGKEKEQWLVFGAKGFEGTAYLGLRLTKKRPTPKKDMHFYVFSGC